MFVEGAIRGVFLDAWDAEIEFHVPDTLPNGDNVTVTWRCSHFSRP